MEWNDVQYAISSSTILLNTLPKFQIQTNHKQCVITNLFIYVTTVSRTRFWNEINFIISIFERNAKALRFY